MQQLTIQAATHLSAQGLYSALSEFQPELHTDAENRCFVSVQLGSDRHVVDVLAAIQHFADSRAAGALENSVVFELAERQYTIHPD